MPTERITATYRVETPLPLDRAAEVLAEEQSCGTFVAVPGETSELRQRFGARVEKIVELDAVATPSLPGSRTRESSPRYLRGELTISWPLANVGTNLPALVSTLQGNLYELSQFSGLKLLDFELPTAFLSRVRGPAFGVAGTRDLTGVRGRPIMGTIIKPSIGLSPQQTAEIVKTLAEAGIDFVKDDELMADPPHSPFTQRVDAVMRVINDHADRTGKRVMYAFNISDDLEAMQRNYDHVASAGGTCVMVSINPVGLAATRAICDRRKLVVHAHRNGFGMMHRHPMLGMEFAPYAKLWRMGGVDQLHVNGIANKFWESDDSVVASIKACQSCLGPLAPLLPVVSSGQTGLQAPETYRRTATTDLLYQAGGGIMAHPLGPAAGVAAIQQCWAAAVSGVPLETYARDHVELREQLLKFGKES